MSHARLTYFFGCVLPTLALCSLKLSPFFFVHMCNHRLKCSTYFRLSYILLERVSASLGHHQVCTLLLKLLHCHFSMSHVNVLLIIILKSSKVHKIADSAALYLVVRCWCFVCCGGIWIPTPS
jgi:hypothetical protein